MVQMVKSSYSIINWPTKATVSDYLDNFCSYILRRIEAGNTNLVFDRYYDFSIKSSTRSGRGKSISRTYQLNATSPLPPRATTLASSNSKSQLIDLICDRLISVTSSKKIQFSMILTGSSMTPTEVQNGVVIKRNDLSTTHEEADIIMVQQAYQSVIDTSAESICVISDDTDVFVLLVYFYDKLGIEAKVYMQATSRDRNIIDISDTVINNKEIIPSILASHAASGCDTVAPYHGIGKTSVIKKLRDGKELKLLGVIEASMNDIINETATLITSCYGLETNNMTECRINSWCQKTSKARKSAPTLRSLPPTHESFVENVKRAHFQSAISYATMNQHPPDLDPTLYGWERDEINKVLCPIGIPNGVEPAPPEILNLIRCSCSSSKPCATKRCSCAAAKVSCSLMCSCRGDSKQCFSHETKSAECLKDDEV